MSLLPLSSGNGSAAASEEAAAPTRSNLAPGQARQWQSYLNRGMAQNARAALPAGAQANPAKAPAMLASNPTAQLLGRPLSRPDLPVQGRDSPPPGTARGRSAPGGGPPPGAFRPTGENLPPAAEGLSTRGGVNSSLDSQVVAGHALAGQVGVDGMPFALPAPMMIADLSAARFSSLDPSTPNATPTDAHGSGSGGTPTFVPSPRGDSTEIRPMRWLLPWLWQLSQSPVDEGEPIEWEVDLPEGGRLRLHAVCHYGEWILDFAGSSTRLQHWLGHHRDELANRLQRIIGKPVHVFIDPPRTLQTAS